ncbi:uncharacterized protein LOC121707480 [Alosa sapidissima]|uniref:uncharacterized protein LOC121707480 n=1 Tax=Alosa sapidissima TaxID=34773 RepID=UPI001C07F106|nr:uncharacterized protein LOC121707480 [Alosa sapidissima]
MDISSSDFPSLRRRFLDSRIVMLKDVVDLAGSDFQNARRFAASIGLRSLRVATQLLDKWRTTCNTGGIFNRRHCTKHRGSRGSDEAAPTPLRSVVSPTRTDRHRLRSNRTALSSPAAATVFGVPPRVASSQSRPALLLEYSPSLSQVASALVPSLTSKANYLPEFRVSAHTGGTVVQGIMVNDALGGVYSRFCQEGRSSKTWWPSLRVDVSSSSLRVDVRVLLLSGDHSSATTPITCGVPQGSILGPVLFSLYMLPLGNIIRRHGIDFHSYADNTQLYLSVSPNDTSPIANLIQCIERMNTWMSNNFLQLNKDKTEVLVIGPKPQRELISNNLNTLAQNIKPLANNLGVLLDPDLNFESHINHVTSCAFYHLRNISKMRPLLTQADPEKVHAFITSKLDYCNALFTGLSKKNITKKETKKRAHITPILKSLHWLPVSFRIDFKVLLLVSKALNDLAPVYISDLLSPYLPSRPLRSSDSGLLVTPRVRTNTHGEAAFAHYGPALWNSLPLALRMVQSVELFKKHLKTYLFSLAFS